MVHPVAVFYGSLCALTLWTTLHSRQRDRLAAFMAGVALSAGCLLSNIAWARNEIVNWIPVDAAVMIALLGLMWWTRRAWTTILASLAVLTMGIHAGLETLHDRSATIMYAYAAVLNAIFVLQLLCVASNGAKGARDHGTVWLVFNWPRDFDGFLGRLRRLAHNPRGHAR